MEATFGVELSQFVEWYLAEFQIATRPTSWFATQIGLDGKYFTRWTTRGLLPNDDNWDQFSRKLREAKPGHAELHKRLDHLTHLHDLARRSGTTRQQVTRPKPPISGIDQYFDDIVDIVDPWQDLFRESRCLDLVVMYASTWRNTYLKHLREMLRKPSSSLRVVLPQSDPSLFQVYSSRLNSPAQILESRIDDAVTEFKDLGNYGRVEIYKTLHYMNHAMYLFDRRGVLSFYSFRTDRCPTPALLIKEGALFQFARRDFAWLIDKKNRASKLVFSSK